MQSVVCRNVAHLAVGVPGAAAVDLDRLHRVGDPGDLLHVALLRARGRVRRRRSAGRRAGAAEPPREISQPPTPEHQDDGHRRPR